ncbi:MCE family protein [Mycobacterium shimoidei]|uniref:MCE family protein n=1 Tax=Mycobacterium shimoidei TaxID=29313 RepID=UPI000848904D|nr:MlaD family protein [Mycobacterium shimoidei]MCV7260430.1 MCE family protein [Mycobacterium shimoidei]ODR11291.1 mammalian cell entry protein [Mycobacterium shimoidei]ORW78159.1 mammalian cell entry protein [Mycobacterium shimoidei]
MLPRLIKIQLLLLAVFGTFAVVVLGWYFLRIPSLVGIGRYTLYAELPRSGGLYRTANVTYRGITIGKVTDVQPTERGARAAMSIDNGYQIPADASANVHSVSPVGEQYVDLVSTSNRGPYLRDGQTITRTKVPSSIGPALDAANRGLELLPKDKIASLLTETSRAVGGLGPALQRLVEATGALAHDFKGSIDDINDIIDRSAPIIDSQVDSGGAIGRWAANLNTLAAQTARHDQEVRSILTNVAPTVDQVNATFSEVRDALPQALANLAVVLDMLKRYHNGVEQALVYLPQSAATGQSALAAYPDHASLNLALSINQPPPCLTGFLPASEWRSPADTSTAPLPSGTYCKIPQDTPANVVRGARNYPCVDVPGKRAATPRECRSSEPYVPLGTNPWYGDPNQILNCPAPGARCDQPVTPGQVIPAPSVNSGLNPAPADQVAGTPPPVSDPLSRPGSGTVQCNGQQPNPCVYTPTTGPTAIYDVQSGVVAGPDGRTYSVQNSTALGDAGWKDMLAPADRR